MTAASNSKARPLQRKSWRDEVDQNFVKYWVAQKRNRWLFKTKDEIERDRQFRDSLREMSGALRGLEKSRAKIKKPFQNALMMAINAKLDCELFECASSRSEGEATQLSAVNPEGSPIFRYLVFLKHGVTFRELVEQIDLHHNDSAYQKLLAVHRDYRRMLSGARFTNLKLRFALDHFQIIVQGYDFGLENLPSDDLAECLDEICPCGQKHSIEYLKKLRTTIKKAANAARPVHAIDQPNKS